MTTTLEIFVSSKMQELKPEREALYRLLPSLDFGDIRLKAWVFEEDAPASNKAIRDICLQALQNSALYIGLFWNEYGEYTIEEFERATDWGLERHIYVKDLESEKRDSRLISFLNKQGDVNYGTTAKWFKTVQELEAGVKKSIERWIQSKLRAHPGATSAVLAEDPDDLVESPRKLIGRDQLRNEIGILLGQRERVLLHGFSGMGKTALAAAVSADWIKAGNGKVLWLKTGSAPAETLFEALARPFGQERAVAQENDDTRIQTFRKLLRESGVKLLVLDDCWNGEALFTLTKAIPSDMAVLATARQRYGLERIRDVGELQPMDALQLLEYHADAPQAAEQTAAQLCKTLGHHAFAIEIAGKTLKARQWTPQQLLTKIKDAPHNLNTPADFGDKERASVKDLLDSSVEILDGQARTLFLSFGSFFAPGATSELLKLHMQRQIESAIDTLQIHGLIKLVPARDQEVEHYRIHDLAYSYARAQALEAQREKALETCLAYTRQHNQPSPYNFAALRPVLDNIIGAVEWAFETQRYAVVEEFVQAMQSDPNSSAGFLLLRGFPDQATKLLLRAASAAEKKGSRKDQGKYLGMLGSAYRELGQYPRAIEYLEMALAIAREVADHQSEGAWLGGLGIVCDNQGQYARALDYYEQALKIARDSHEQRSESSILGNLATIYRNQGQYARAIEHYEKALLLARNLGDRFREGVCLGNLGRVYEDNGQHARAVESYEGALTITREIGDRRGEGVHLGSLGSVYRELGDYARAIEYHEQALSISQEVGNRRNEGICLGNLGLTYINLEQYERAIGYIEQARSIAHALGDRFSEGINLSNLGDVYRKTRQYPQAADYYEQSLAIAIELGDQLGEGLNLGNLGHTHYEQGHYAPALELYERARQIFIALNVAHLINEVNQHIAATMTRLGNPPPADEQEQRWL
jgi:tetratricopeptide (TPR) repeat protein